VTSAPPSSALGETPVQDGRVERRNQVRVDRFLVVSSSFGVNPSWRDQRTAVKRVRWNPCRGADGGVQRCPVRLRNSQDVSLVQRVLMTLVLRLIMNDGFSNRLFRVLPGLMGKPQVTAVEYFNKRNNKTRSYTWAKRIYIWRLLSNCRTPLNRRIQARVDRFLVVPRSFPDPFAEFACATRPCRAL